jgi:hypothetical protein
MRSELVKEWASAARDVLALLFTPVATVISATVIAIMAGWCVTWTVESELARINWLGSIGVIYAVLVGLGGQWFQRNRLEKLKLSGPGGFGGEIETEAEPGPTITTTIETEVKP